MTAPDQRDIKQKLVEPICRRTYGENEDEYPNKVAKADSLGGIGVHCFGRTSGLQGGIVGPAMSSVRIYRRKSFSRSWHVVGNFGVGGDSGAWVIQNSTHRVCGHVLAWCERNNLAYICPMEVLLEDIKRTLGAKRIYLPGSAEEATHHSSYTNGKATTTAAINNDSSSNSKISEIAVGVETLGIIDSAVDMRTSTYSTATSTGSSPNGAAPPRRSRLDLPPLVTNSNGGGESDKENLPVLRSRVMHVKEGRGGAGLEMVTPPPPLPTTTSTVQVGGCGGRGRGIT